MNEVQNVDTLTTEILFLKQQTAQNIIEIGKRLVAVKEGLPHGEFGKWLDEKVDFSQQTANKFMKVANEFEDYATLRNLGTGKIFALLSLPQEEREEFIQTNPVEGMTTKEFQQAIKDKKELENKLKTAEAQIETERNSYEKVSDSYKRLERTNQGHYEKSEKLRKQLIDDKQIYENKLKAIEITLQKEKDSLKKEKENSKEEITKLQTFIGEAKANGNNEEVTRLQASLKEIQIDLDSSAQKIDELETQLKEKPIDVITAEPVVIEKIPEEVQRELEEFRSKGSQNTTQPVIKFKIYYEELQKTFREELEIMAEIKKDYPETYEKCKSNILKLINGMAEHL
ncbi:MAG: chromosome segregation ATPase [Clostridium sp.]|jgi:chromosome segregation ATPase